MTWLLQVCWLLKPGDDKQAAPAMLTAQQDVQMLTINNKINASDRCLSPCAVLGSPQCTVIDYFSQVLALTDWLTTP